MKSFICVLALSFCLLTSFAFADVSGDPVAIDLDDKGNIRVWVQYDIDGKIVESRYVFKNGIIYNARNKKIGEYSDTNFDGKQFYCSRFSKQNFLGMTTKEEVRDRINQDISTHDKTLIEQTFNKNAIKTINQMRIDYNRQANQDFMDSAIFPDLIGKKITEKDTTIILDTDGDGVNDKEILIKTDGSQSISPISP